MCYILVVTTPSGTVIGVTMLKLVQLFIFLYFFVEFRIFFCSGLKKIVHVTVIYSCRISCGCRETEGGCKLSRTVSV